MIEVPTTVLNDIVDNIIKEREVGLFDHQKDELPTINYIVY